MFADEHRLQHAKFTNRRGQSDQRLLIKRPTWLIRVGHDVANWDISKWTVIHWS
jgi:hypothetical protein